MPIKEGREYRTFNASEFSAKQEDESYIVEGYATTFDVPYDFGFSGVKEQVSRTALDEADMSDVIFQYDHKGRVLARQRNNSLVIMPDEHGLYVRADLSGSEQGRQLWEEIKNGLTDRMSWGFLVPEDGWDYDVNTRTSTITRITKVFDVSAVSIPANDDTEIKVRSYIDGVIEEMERQELSQRQSEDADKWAAILEML